MRNLSKRADNEVVTETGDVFPTYLITYIHECVDEKDQSVTKIEWDRQTRTVGVDVCPWCGEEVEPTDYIVQDPLDCEIGWEDPYQSL